MDYYKGVNIKAEDILDFRQDAALASTPDVDIFMRSIVVSLPTSEEIYP